MTNEARRTLEQKVARWLATLPAAKSAAVLATVSTFSDELCDRAMCAIQSGDFSKEAFE